MSKLKELIAELEKVGGPDRELDGKIHNLIHGTEYVRSSASVTGYFTSATDNGCPHVERYTASLDAAVDLVNRVLPGAKWEVTTTGFKPGCTIIMLGKVAGGAYAGTPTLAIIVAVLRAKLAQEEA